MPDNKMEMPFVKKAIPNRKKVIFTILTFCFVIISLIQWKNQLLLKLIEEYSVIREKELV